MPNPFSLWNASCSQSRSLYYFFGFLFVVALSSCGGSLCDSLDTRIKDLTEDGQLSASELTAIKGLIEAKKGAYARCGLVKEDALDQQALQDRIAAICPSCTSTTGSSRPVRFVYQAYIENSGSMDGYVEGNTQFKQTLFAFLSDLVYANKLTDSLGLSYINAGITPFQGALEDFIQRLDPATFKSRRQPNTNTNIADLLKNLLANAASNQMSILASDFIFSPGRNQDAGDYLVNQQISIKNTFASHLDKQQDLELLLIKLDSRFNGLYYDYNNRGFVLENTRPYYILVAGPSNGMQLFMDRMDIESLRGYQNHYFLSLSNGNEPGYKVAQYHTEGSRYSPCRSSSTTCLASPKPASRGEAAGRFRFSLAVDYSKLYLGDSYLENTEQYTVDHGFSLIEVLPVSRVEKEKDEKLTPFTHFLVLETDRAREGTVQIQLKDQIPVWVENATSRDDRQQEGGELDKTFGLAYLIRGMQEAYQARSPGYKREHLVEFAIQIEN